MEQRIGMQVIADDLGGLELELSDVLDEFLQLVGRLVERDEHLSLIHI